MKKVVVVLAMVFSLLIAQIAGASEVDAKFAETNKWLKQNNLQFTQSPDDVFLQDYILVYGEGLPFAASKSKAQKKTTAIRAAITDAQRKLAEILVGVAVVGETLVKDAQLQSDIVRTAVSGVVRGAAVVRQEYNEAEESALVVMRVAVKGKSGFAGTMYEKVITNPQVKPIVEKTPVPTFKPEQPPVVAEVFDGLIIDATEQSFRPALINRIFNPKGEALYDPTKISQKVLVERGCGEYTTSVAKAKAALEMRGVKNPLVIKASGLVTPSDLQVSSEDALKIYSANEKGNFLASAKVAFVLK